MTSLQSKVFKGRPLRVKFPPCLLLFSTHLPPPCSSKGSLWRNLYSIRTKRELWSRLFNKEQFLCVLRCPFKLSSDISAALLPWSVDVFSPRKAICSAGMLCPCSAKQFLSVTKSPYRGTGTWSQLMDLFHLLSCQFFLATASNPWGWDTGPYNVPLKLETGGRACVTSAERRCLKHCWLYCFLTRAPFPTMLFMSLLLWCHWFNSRELQSCMAQR